MLRVFVPLTSIPEESGSALKLDQRTIKSLGCRNMWIYTFRICNWRAVPPKAMACANGS